MWWYGWSVAGQVYPFKVILVLPRLPKGLFWRLGAPFCTQMLTFVQQSGKVLLSCFSDVSSCVYWVQPKKTQRWKMAGTSSPRHWGTVHTLFCRGCGHQAPCCASSCPTSCHSKEIPQFLMSFWSCPCQKLGFSIWRMKLMSSLHFSRC